MKTHAPFFIALFASLNVLNYLDRYIISAVGPSMQIDLGLSDAQFGAIGEKERSDEFYYDKPSVITGHKDSAKPSPMYQR